EVPGEFRQYNTSVLASRRLRSLRFPYDEDADNDVARKRAAFLGLYQDAAALGMPIGSYLGNTGVTTLLASESYTSLHSLYTGARGAFSDAYDDLDTGLGYALREAAKVVYGVSQGVPNVEARFLQVSDGGYDTHSDQGGGETTGQHYRLLAELGDSLKLFYD